MQLTVDEAFAIAANVKSMLRDMAPYDTGNLSRNSLTLTTVEPGLYVISIDTGIAPYMKYTNEDWNNYAPPLQGHKNPNEGWWDEACKEAIEYVQRLLEGELKQNG